MGKRVLSVGFAAVLTTLSVSLHAEEDAASGNEPPTGLLFRVDGSFVPAFGYQNAQGRGYDGTDYVMESGYSLLGGRVGVGLGYAFDSFRVGVRGAGQLSDVVGGGGGIPHTGLDGLLVYSLGPTLGLRLWKCPIELEIEAAYAAQFWLGSQNAIGAPDNLYPLGATQRNRVFAVTRVRELCDRPVASAKSFVEQPASAERLQLSPLINCIARRSTRGRRSPRIECMRQSIWEVLECIRLRSLRES